MDTNIWRTSQAYITVTLVANTDNTFYLHVLYTITDTPTYQLLNKYYVHTKHSGVKNILYTNTSLLH